MTNTVLDVQKNSFVQHVADNADHDTCTLDGKGTFHGMAIIAAITPGVQNLKVIVPRKKVSIILYLKNLTFKVYLLIYELSLPLG